MSKKVALHNLGCKVNAYEVEAMQQLLEKAGYEIVPFEEEMCIRDRYNLSALLFLSSLFSSSIICHFFNPFAYCVYTAMRLHN